MKKLFTTVAKLFNTDNEPNLDISFNPAFDKMARMATKIYKESFNGDVPSYQVTKKAYGLEEKTPQFRISTSHEGGLYSQRVMAYPDNKYMEHVTGLDLLEQFNENKLYAIAYDNKKKTHYYESCTGIIKFKWKGQPVVMFSMVIYDALMQGIIAPKELALDMLDTFNNEAAPVYTVPLENGYWSVIDMGDGRFMMKQEPLPKKKTDSSFLPQLKDNVAHFFNVGIPELNTQKTIQEKVEAELKESGEEHESMADYLNSTEATLLYGPVGTGKTTGINYVIHNEWSKEHVVVMCKSINEMAYAAQEITTQGYSGIIVLEECDAAFGKLDSSGKANGNVKSFLDGSLSPYNPKGLYYVFVTNHIEEISKDILERSGRIQNTLFVDNLRGEEAIKVTKLYFRLITNKGFKVDEQIYSMFDGISGDKIKHVAAMVFRHVSSKALKENLEPASITVDRKMVEELISSTQIVTNYKNASLTMSKPTVGFSTN